MRRVIPWVAVLVLAGCGASVVQAPRKNLVPVELQKFPRQDWRLANNKFFLWRDGLTPETVSTAQRIAKRIDQLDTDALPLVRRMGDLGRRIDPLKDSQKLIASNARMAKAAHEKAKKRVETAQKELAGAQAAHTQDLEKIAALKAQIALGNDQVKEVGTLREKLEKDQKAIETQLAPLTTEFDELDGRQQAIEGEGRQKVAEITELVDWYKDQPSAVIFAFNGDGTISAQISDWNLGDDAGPRTFTTDSVAGAKPTITNVKYEVVGGVFTFDVQVYEDEAQTKLRENYNFKISRINYEARDGRNFFGGDIIRTRGTEVRRGIAKLVDRNN